MPIPGTATAPEEYPRGAHRAYRSCIDAVLRYATRSQAQRGCECLPELLQFVTFPFLSARMITEKSDIPESSIPRIQSTIPSPLQYGYRTKITPHFEPPPKKLQKQASTSTEVGKPSWLKIGFNQIGRRVVMDIEVWKRGITIVVSTIRPFGLQECPIATPVLNEAYGPMRDDIAK